MLGRANSEPWIGSTVIARAFHLFFFRAHVHWTARLPSRFVAHDWTCVSDAASLHPLDTNRLCPTSYAVTVCDMAKVSNVVTLSDVSNMREISPMYARFDASAEVPRFAARAQSVIPRRGIARTGRGSRVFSGLDAGLEHRRLWVTRLSPLFSVG
jgi:hypothetical protein